MRLIIESGIPPTLNEMLAAANRRWANRRGSDYSRLKQEWGEYFRDQILHNETVNIQPSGDDPWEKAWVYAQFWCQFGRDADNLCSSLKFIFDALVHEQLRILRDDSLMVVQGLDFDFYQAPKAQHRAVVTVSDGPIFAPRVFVPDPDSYLIRCDRRFQPVTVPPQKPKTRAAPKAATPKTSTKKRTRTKTKAA